MKTVTIQATRHHKAENLSFNISKDSYHTITGNIVDLESDNGMMNGQPVNKLLESVVAGQSPATVIMTEEMQKVVKGATESFFKSNPAEIRVNLKFTAPQGIGKPSIGINPNTGEESISFVIRTDSFVEVSSAEEYLDLDLLSSTMNVSKALSNGRYLKQQASKENNTPSQGMKNILTSILSQF